MRKTGWIKLAAWTVLIAVCSVLTAACGSSGDPGSKNNAKFDAGLAFSRCMRAHGVSSFPDPSSGGGGFHIQITAGSGIDPFSPSFKAARSSCRKLLPDGGPGAGHPTAQAKAQMLEISQCMREHGIAGFPDPTTSPPSGPPANSAVLGRDGVFLVLPNTIDTQSPAFQQAAKACKFPGP